MADSTASNRRTPGLFLVYEGIAVVSFRLLYRRYELGWCIRHPANTTRTHSARPIVPRNLDRDLLLFRVIRQFRRNAIQTRASMEDYS